MSKRYEEEQWCIEHADSATITFTIALHGPHAWGNTPGLPIQTIPNVGAREIEAMKNEWSRP
jgi:hypothetical protein